MKKTLRELRKGNYFKELSRLSVSRIHNTMHRIAYALGSNFFKISFCSSFFTDKRTLVASLSSLNLLFSQATFVREEVVTKALRTSKQQAWNVNSLILLLSSIVSPYDLVFFFYARSHLRARCTLNFKTKSASVNVQMNYYKPLD